MPLLGKKVGFLVPTDMVGTCLNIAQASERTKVLILVAVLVDSSAAILLKSLS